MNRVVLMGRLTRDPDVKYQQGENPMAIARFTLAVDRRGKQGEADFISCVAFGKTGQFAEKYLYKGTKVALEGRIQTGSYTKQDGSKVYTTDVVVDQVEFAESKASQQPAQQGYQQMPQQGYQPVPQQGYQQPQQGYTGQPPLQMPVYPQQGYQQPQQPQYQQQTFSQTQQAPMAQAAQEGFTAIPDALEDEGLPFN